ncbi:fibroblast growth factor 1 isoform X3 [Delphinapterus leucas]|uniref:Fibroblast growth factor 1 isoform X3 n=2 Tax=Odontoceti TaxID=9722 RepID=A0A2Y9PFK8_DELLE|nr:fibroblast growth factor 1 isoform X3 [Delphinapterus leucas]
MSEVCCSTEDFEALWGKKPIASSLESAITRSCSAMAEGEITTFTALTEKFNLPPGNYKKPKLLYCSNGGHFLRILPDGTVDGTRDRSDQHRYAPKVAGTKH